jgi:hypothetical protein
MNYVLAPVQNKLVGEANTQKPGTTMATFIACPH